MGTRLNQEAVLKRFKDKWPDWETRYDYSTVGYINSRAPVEIYCIKHSRIFKQNACDHWLGKQGCKECKKDDKRALYASNKEDFVKKSNQIHGLKYNYDKVTYVNARTNIIITCPLHGDFDQTPEVHHRGNGCDKCGDERGASKNALPFSDFQKRGNLVHLSKFAYDEESYFSASRKSKIICPHHGEFYQLPGSHIRGAGCKDCSVEAFTLSQTIREEKTVTDAIKKIYGNKYRIISFFLKENKQNKKRRWFRGECNRHGKFEMPCSSLLSQGSIGCIPCKSEKIGNAHRSSTNEFIARATTLHDGFFDYSKVNYQKARLEVTITCPSHGDFEQTPDSHLAGRGCRKCADENLTGMLLEGSFPPDHPYGIYLIELQNVKTKEKYLKVGLTSTSVKTRFSALSKDYQFKIHAFLRVRYADGYRVADKEWIGEIQSRKLVNPPDPPLHSKGRSFGGHECSFYNQELLLKYIRKLAELELQNSRN